MSHALPEDEFDAEGLQPAGHEPPANPPESDEVNFDSLTVGAEAEPTIEATAEHLGLNDLADHHPDGGSSLPLQFDAADVSTQGSGLDLGPVPDGGGMLESGLDLNPMASGSAVTKVDSQLNLGLAQDDDVLPLGSSMALGPGDSELDLETGMESGGPAMGMGSSMELDPAGIDSSPGFEGGLALGAAGAAAGLGAGLASQGEPGASGFMAQEIPAGGSFLEQGLSPGLAGEIPVASEGTDAHRDEDDEDEPEEEDEEKLTRFQQIVVAMHEAPPYTYLLGVSLLLLLVGVLLLVLEWRIFNFDTKATGRDKIDDKAAMTAPFRTEPLASRPSWV